MKKILFSLMLAVVACVLTTSCSEDRDSNPAVNTKNLSLVLNTPGISYNNVYDLQNSTYVELTTSQPNYGFPCPTTYSVMVSLDATNWTTLGTTYESADILVPASELNEAICEIVGDANTDKLADPQLVYVKISAHITGQDNLGYVESNVVPLSKVLAYVKKVELTLPTTMYIVGSFEASKDEDGNAWKTFVPLHFAYSQDGFSYGVVYLAAGDSFKVNPDNDWKGNDKGFGQVALGDDNAAELSSEDGSEASNIKVGKSGWYTVVVKNKIQGNAITYELNTREAQVYVIGGCTDSSDWGWNDSWKFTMSSSAAEPCVSPTLANAAELRLAVDCGIDWWKTEFTIMNTDASLFYRNCDIPNNWAENIGEDYSFQGTAGKKIYLDFTKGTGECK